MPDTHTAARAPRPIAWMFAASLLAVAICPLTRTAAAAEPSPFQPQGVAFLKQYCIDCHGAEEPEADLNLARFTTDASLLTERNLWDKVLKAVQTGQMPPPDAARPKLAEIDLLLTSVKGVFAEADRNAKPQVGKVTVRRLNRTEYNNTIRDLIGVDFQPAEDFPSDDIGHGFDNIGDVLTLSPVLMERYLAASESIVQRAITPNPPKPPKRHLSTRYSEPASANVPLRSNYRFLSTIPGGGAVETGPIFTRYMMEGDGEYIFRIKVYAEREKTLEAVTNKEKPKESLADDLLDDLNQGAKEKQPAPAAGVNKPVFLAILAAGKGLADGVSDEEAAKIWGQSVASLRPFKIMKIVEVKAREAAKAEVIVTEIPPTPGIDRMAVALLSEPAGTPPAKLYVEYLSLEGPLDTRPASHRRIIQMDDNRPKTEQTAEVLRRFARRAYRRPPTAEELARLVALADAVAEESDNWEAGIQRVVQALLVSPKFLFRLELDDRPVADTPTPLNEHQLASRLSYFLWSSMPDDELLDLADQGQLSSQLEPQVRRMLLDPKADALIDNFALQWLQLRRINIVAPDNQLFPTFNEPLREAMLTETRLFLAEIMREDRSILDLIDADFTYLNEPLARHYGIADTAGNLVGKNRVQQGGKPIRGNEFQRVSLAQTGRAGLLTQASVLTVTSNPTRTSPVKRGRWVLEQILGTPPPPPPPDVPLLEEGEQAALTGTLRERMQQHMKNPSCAACHVRMDPLGFAFENYDAIGKFRQKDGDFEIDPSGTLPDGKSFQGPPELRAILKSQSDLFSQCLTEKMLTYALGRGLEYYDRPTIDRIQQTLAQHDHKFSTLVLEIVKSDPFRKRPGKEATSHE